MKLHVPFTYTPVCDSFSIVMRTRYCVVVWDVTS